MRRRWTETIEYFKKNGVRAVNMSWGGNAEERSKTRSKRNNAGGTPEERKELARKIYTIGDTAFKNAIHERAGTFCSSRARATRNLDNEVRRVLSVELRSAEHHFHRRGRSSR
jgi:hypothetical protein